MIKNLAPASIRIVERKIDKERVNFIYQWIKNFRDGGNSDLKQHYESGLLERDILLDGYAQEEIDLARTWLSVEDRNKAFADAVNRGDIPPWVDWTDYP